MILSSIGWDIREAVFMDRLRAADDVGVVLRYAKRSQRVLLSADMFEDRGTRTALREDIRRSKRGRVISVGGGPQQSWEKIVAKLLYHREEFETFFSGSHGIVQVGNLKPETLRMQRPEQINLLKTKPVQQGEKYLKRPHQPRLRRALKAKLPRASAPLPEGEGGPTAHETNREP